jgi:hypothetical protein
MKNPIEEAWEHFTEELSIALARLEEDQYLTLSLKDTGNWVPGHRPCLV